MQAGFKQGAAAAAVAARQCVRSPQRGEKGTHLASMRPLSSSIMPQAEPAPSAAAKRFAELSTRHATHGDVTGSR